MRLFRAFISLRVSISIQNSFLNLEMSSSSRQTLCEMIKTDSVREAQFVINCKMSLCRYQHYTESKCAWFILISWTWSANLSYVNKLHCFVVRDCFYTNKKNVFLARPSCTRSQCTNQNQWSRKLLGMTKFPSFPQHVNYSLI